MLVKLLRPLLESGWNSAKLVSSQNLSISSVFFQQSFSGTNTGGSAKTTDKAPNLKNQQKNQQQKSGNKNKSRAESDAEQEQSQQEGPADKAAERKSSDNNDRPTKSRK